MNTQHHAHGRQATASSTHVGLDPDIEKKYFSDGLESNLTGFIYHPPGFQITWRKIRARHNDSETVLPEHGNIGLCFSSVKYIKPGTLLELAIQLRGEIQTFRGRVVLVKNKGNQHEIGVWFTSREDASRIRIVEQICHIETYLRQKRHKEGPFLSNERIAEEWITRFASSFPSFG